MRPANYLAWINYTHDAYRKEWTGTITIEGLRVGSVSSKRRKETEKQAQQMLRKIEGQLGLN